MPGCPVNSQVQRKHLFVKFRMLAFTLVFYFIIVFPKWFIGINNCSMWTHVRDKSACSISHKEGKTIKLNYLSVKAVFDRAKRDVLKSLCYDLKYLWFPSFSFYFPFRFPFPSLPFLFFSFLFSIPLSLSYWHPLPPLLSLHPRLKLIYRKQTTGCMKWRLFFLLSLLRENRQYKKHRLITVFHLKGRNRLDNT